MQDQSQPEAQQYLLAEATQVVWRASAVRDIAVVNPKVPDAVVNGLDDLKADLQHLRDAIHDAALDPADELALPRLGRNTYPQK
jgi:hypothetical protein